MPVWTADALRHQAFLLRQHGASTGAGRGIQRECEDESQDLLALADELESKQAMHASASAARQRGVLTECLCYRVPRWVVACVKTWCERSKT